MEKIGFEMDVFPRVHPIKALLKVPLDLECYHRLHDLVDSFYQVLTTEDHLAVPCSFLDETGLLGYVDMKEWFDTEGDENDLNRAFIYIDPKTHDGLQETFALPLYIKDWQVNDNPIDEIIDCTFEYYSRPFKRKHRYDFMDCDASLLNMINQACRYLNDYENNLPITFAAYRHTNNRINRPKFTIKANVKKEEDRIMGSITLDLTSLEASELGLKDIHYKSYKLGDNHVQGK